MAKSKRGRKKKSKAVQVFEVVRSSVAGIDLGSREHWVCGPVRECGTPEICSFRTTTAGLEELAEWLLDRGVESAAMESTSVYWVPIYDILEEAGLEVLLVNAQHVRHVPGRKSDIADCQWLQKLHAAGLLRGSFRPHESITALRSLHRQQRNIASERKRAVQWMQKSFDQMNIALHHAVTDITGATGMAIIRAIAEGERDPHRLASFRDHRCAKSVAEIAEHLTGNWREEHLFNLREALALYDTLEAAIQRYSKELHRQIQALQIDDLPELGPHPDKRKAKAIRRKGQEALRLVLIGMAGEDLTTIDGISVEAALTFLTEVGPDVSMFPTENHLVSWLGLSPSVGYSAGKAVKRNTKGLGQNLVGNTLRICAMTLRRSKTSLGARYRRVSRTKDGRTAAKDVARQLAKLIYRMLRYGKAYVDAGAAAYEKRYEEQRLRGLRAAAKDLGFQLVEAAE